MIEAVQAERSRVGEELERLDDALHALQKVAAHESDGRQARASRSRRRMSAAARKRIAAAQRARWAGNKKQQ